MLRENKLALAALLVGLVALGLGVFKGGKTTETIRETVRELVGATPGSEFQEPVLTVGGVRTFYKHLDMLSGTNTPCSLKNTDFGTSTIDYISVKQTSGATTAIRWVISTSTTQTATGTPYQIAGFTVSANDKVNNAIGGGYLNPMTTASSTQQLVVKPNDWINVNVAGVAGLTTSQIAGSCNFILKEL